MDKSRRLSIESDDTIDILANLSQLSCSTANNEDFYVVPSTDEENSRRKETEEEQVEAPRREHISPSLNVSFCSASAHTPTLKEMAPKPRSLLSFPSGSSGYRPGSLSDHLQSRASESPLAHTQRQIRPLNIRTPNFFRPKTSVGQSASSSFTIPLVPGRNVNSRSGDHLPIPRLSFGPPRLPPFLFENGGPRSSAHPRSPAHSRKSPSIDRGDRENNNNDLSSVSPSVVSRHSMFSRQSAVRMRQFGDGITTTNYEYPLVHVSQAGTISLVLSEHILVEMAIDRSIRLVSHEHFAVSMNARGNSSGILHPRARMLHHEERVWTKFSSSNDKMAAFSPEGVFFTMSHLQEGYLVSTQTPLKGAVAVPLDHQQFSGMDDDFTMKLFYSGAQTGPEFFAQCKEIVHDATYDRRSDGTLWMNVNGMTIKQNTNGEIHVDARPRQITCNPRDCTIHLRSPYVDMAVQLDEKAYVKHGMKRVHVSRSGMVVSDGNSITSMDHFGRIVSCT